ncbi:hypothetical protein N7G274_003114 [Stereocaulon virgatum]|uniref:Uncharacterized protein n=1 Tax=Stereocaulon virgatum TaxID=373712 RepID=A0ABR4AFY8_9LECA
MGSFSLSSFSQLVVKSPNSSKIRQVASSFHFPGILSFNARNAAFHTKPRRLKQDQDSPKTPEQDQMSSNTPVRPSLDSSRYFDEFEPNFNKLNPDKKFLAIHSFRLMVERDGQSGSPELNEKEREEVIKQMIRLEKETRDKDRWYYKAFRGIAWGPTILVNAILYLL